MDGFITAGLAAVVIYSFVLLFQKTKTKKNAQVKIIVMIILEILEIASTITFLSTLDKESETWIIVFMLLFQIACISFIGYKMYKTYLQLKNDDFPSENE